MNITKELELHARAIEKINGKYTSRFKAAKDQAINAKARNIQSMDRLVADNQILDGRMKELETALAITDY